MKAHALVCLLLLPALLRPALEAPAPLTPTAAALPAPLAPYQPEANKPVEDFFVISIISLPFTALWSLVGAAVVASIAQRKVPPEFNEAALIGAGATALGLSLGIGLVSVQWGHGVKDPKPQQPKGMNDAKMERP